VFTDFVAQCDRCAAAGREICFRTRPHFRGDDPCNYCLVQNKGRCKFSEKDTTETKTSGKKKVSAESGESVSEHRRTSKKRKAPESEDSLSESRSTRRHAKRNPTVPVAQAASSSSSSSRSMVKPPVVSHHSSAASILSALDRAQRRATIDFVHLRDKIGNLCHADSGGECGSNNSAGEESE